MQQITVEPALAGQRLDKFLHRVLPQAGTGFLYKMLRKKNITLNGKKAGGDERLAEGDVVCFFFSEDTFRKLSGPDGRSGETEAKLSAYRDAYLKIAGVSVLYEDARIAVLNKPAGILTQKAKETDLSLNEWLVGYLLDGGKVSADDLTKYKPSVCNRLDRNTSGIVLCGKTLQGAQFLSEGIRDRSISKFYHTLCAGELREDGRLEGYLTKDEKTNRVTVSDAAPQGKAIDADRICTVYHPLASSNGYTLLEVELITGKPHQIRAHLAGIGHPVVGDHKYGNPKINQQMKERFGLTFQLLHAYRVVIPEAESARCLNITAPYPAYFEKIAEASL